MELITHLRSLVEELQVKIVKAKELSSYYGNAKDQQGNDMIKIEKILGESLAKFHSFNNIINDIWKHIQLVSDKSYLNMVDLCSEHEEWNKLGQGAFGQVFKTKFKGTTVAVKVLSQERDDIAVEGHILRHLSHDNIVAFRGTGVLPRDLPSFSLKANTTCIIMEYLTDNLANYVTRQQTPERQGLSDSTVWSLGRQICNALNYLHSLTDPIAHRDLKPDNILLDKSSLHLIVKLADFGLACHSYQLQSEGDTEELVGNVRWTPPECWPPPSLEGSEYSSDGGDHSRTGFYSSPSDASTIEPSIEMCMQGDMYRFGLILAYMLTGCRPWMTIPTQDMMDGPPMTSRGTYEKPLILPPPSLTGPLKDIIDSCYEEAPSKRPSADMLVSKYFSRDENPYQAATLKAEFFSCGFLKDTKIFVADSLVEEKSEGFFISGERPVGYARECLECLVEVKDRPYHIIPEDWELQWKYSERYAHFKKMANRKEIDDNPNQALKSLVMERTGYEELQKLELQFVEGTYCHHRAMRDIWRSFSEAEQNTLVPCKSEVHPIFSTSFGLHVAILTNEGPGKSQKFIFSRRAMRPGMSSPGAFTCGAVESCAQKDYLEKDGATYISMVITAARGLDEELLVKLEGGDLEAICLSTVYLKFDNHEWGMCGYVDLSDQRIRPENRLSYARLSSRFSSGPKDKFEHEEIFAVDFELESMVGFIKEHHRQFASSSKLVVVKVMQAFFGVTRVEHAFGSQNVD